jgi:glycyl-tRNA synthetase
MKIIKNLDQSNIMEKIVSLCKRRGFIFPSSELYGGIRGFWDYGTLGIELKKNIKSIWWNDLTRLRDDVVGLDTSIIMHPQIWEASGHTKAFIDIHYECRLTKQKVRRDNVLDISNIETICRFCSPINDDFYEEIMFAIPKGYSEQQVKDKILNLYSQIYGENFALKLIFKIVSFFEDLNDVHFHPETFIELTTAQYYNLMFRTVVGANNRADIKSSEAGITYLRPETAQAIFVQFNNVLESSRQKVPFGIAQIGKSFRNEVTPKNFTFRSREFEQMELEFFIRPDTATSLLCGEVSKSLEKVWDSKIVDYYPDIDFNEIDKTKWGSEMWYRYWIKKRVEFLNQNIGIEKSKLIQKEQPKEDLAHYSAGCTDILFPFPFGEEEIEGIAMRGTFDLKNHQTHSGKSLEYFDADLKAKADRLTVEEKNLFKVWFKKNSVSTIKEEEKEAELNRLLEGFYIPAVIEPSLGLDRLILAILCDAFSEEAITEQETRSVLRFSPKIAPVKMAIFPLLKKNTDLVKIAKDIINLLNIHFKVSYDEIGSIGKRYRRYDEIGTPFCVTVDFQTLDEIEQLKLDATVSIRDRDSMQQERIKISELKNFLFSVCY